MPSKILTAVCLFASVAYLVLTVMAVTGGEGTYQVVSNAVVAVLFTGLTVVNWRHLRRHRKPSQPMTWDEAKTAQRRFPPRGM